MSNTVSEILDYERAKEVEQAKFCIQAVLADKGLQDFIIDNWDSTHKSVTKPKMDKKLEAVLEVMGKAYMLLPQERLVTFEEFLGLSLMRNIIQVIEYLKILEENNDLDEAIKEAE